MTADESRPPPTQPRLELVPPRRTPPTAVGAGTPLPPHRRRPRPEAGSRDAWLKVVEDAAVEYVGLLRAALARLLGPAR